NACRDSASGWCCGPAGRGVNLFVHYNEKGTRGGQADSWMIAPTLLRLLIDLLMALVHRPWAALRRRRVPATQASQRGPGAGPEVGQGEPAPGLRAHPRRAAETRPSGLLDQHPHLLGHHRIPPAPRRAGLTWRRFLQVSRHTALRLFG